MFEFHRNERARQLRPSLSRSWLLVRANATEDVFEQAFESEADSIIIDLEDGCPPEEKDAAREKVVRMLNSGVVAWVRINAITTEHWWKDVKALKNVKGLRGVMLATIDGPTLGAYGADLSKACGFANDHGMTGKITLDIRQAETINAAFSPSEVEIEEAHQMLDVPIDGPRDGSYLPRYLRAKKVKELAKVYGLWGKTDSDFQRASK